jgi:hypothetical protein
MSDQQPCLYHADVPAVAIKDGNLSLAYADGSHFVMPLRIARMMHGRICTALNEHDHRRADVLPFQPEKPRRRKAATSKGEG